MSQSAPSSRPSLTKCADAENDAEETSADDSRDRGSAIEGIVESCEDEFAGLAHRALSVVPGHRVRKEVTREIRGSPGEFKSKTVIGALKAYLRWLADVEDSQLVFTDPDGGRETAPLPHSFSEEYLGEKYGKLKDFERAFVAEAVNAYTAMLTLSASNLNKRGDPRCPGDHLVDLKDSWDRHVRRELQRVMEEAGFERYDPDDPPERWWEYALVVEPHESGYGHIHVAVFTSDEIDAGMFRPVMEKHVEKCTAAGSDAHQVVEGDSRNSAVSVNGVDPEQEYDPESGDMDDITNLGSYIAAYIGAAGEDLWDRPVSELIFYSLLWSTQTRRIHFSRGAGKLAEEGFEMRNGERAPSETDWELEGIEDKDGDVHKVHESRVCRVCAATFSGAGEECPDCGGELVSSASDFMRRIRGWTSTGGDPPIQRP